MLDPLDSRPRYDILFPVGNPKLAPPGPIPCPAFEGNSPREVFARDGKDPVSLTLWSSGATSAHLREFRTLDGEGRMPQVWKVEGRSAGND